MSIDIYFDEDFIKRFDIFCHNLLLRPFHNLETIRDTFEKVLTNGNQTLMANKFFFQITLFNFFNYKDKGDYLAYLKTINEDLLFFNKTIIHYIDIFYSLPIEKREPLVLHWCNQFSAYESLVQKHIAAAELVDAAEIKLLKPDNKHPYLSNNFFMCLKKFNSVFPNLYHDNNYGGGFYFRIDGKGIVVDPGYSFYKQLKSNNIGIDDIDFIFVSHAHDDHCMDLELIASLLFKYNKLLELDHSIHVFSSSNVFNKYSYLNNLNNLFMYALEPNMSSSSFLGIPNFPSLPFDFLVLKSNHNEQPYQGLGKDSSLGFIFTLSLPGKTVKFLYTGDTSASELDFSQFIYKFDYAIMNIGTIENSVFDIHKNHLGLNGIKRILDTLAFNSRLPRFLLISEFGAEMVNLRIDISLLLQEYVDDLAKSLTSYSTKVVPCEQNLLIDLDSHNIITKNKHIPLNMATFTMQKMEVVYS